jgi:hypothetical protein
VADRASSAVHEVIGYFPFPGASSTHVGYGRIARVGFAMSGVVLYVAVGVVMVVVAAGLGLVLREWYRNPLRREMRGRPITFRTELYRARFPESRWWGDWGETRGTVELVIRGDIVRVGAPFGLVIGPQCYFRAPETTIELSRSPMRIYGIDGKREWIVVHGRQGGREFQLSMTRRYFLEDVWNALVGAGAVPTSGGPSPRRSPRDA